MIIDLCAGEGRFPGEEIINIDIDRKTKPTILASVTHLPLVPGLKPKLLHASPPCTYISKARQWKQGINYKGIAETLKIYSAIYECADQLQPEIFTFKSPQAIEQFIGKKTKFVHPKYDIKKATTNIYCNKKGLKRAILNPGIRQNILELTEEKKQCTYPSHAH